MEDLFVYKNHVRQLLGNVVHNERFRPPVSLKGTLLRISHTVSHHIAEDIDCTFALLKLQMWRLK